MKEATGELNITVITIVAIGALATFFYFVIWPGIRNSMALTTACNADGNSGTYTSGNGSTSEGGVSCTRTNGVVTCTYKVNGNAVATRKCSTTAAK